MHSDSQARPSIEDQILEVGSEEPLLSEKPIQRTQYRNLALWFNILFMVANIIAATSVFLNNSKDFAASKSDYRRQISVCIHGVT